LARGSNLFILITEARIKKIAAKTPNGKPQTKFKIRCARYLYTLSLDDPDKAEKLKLGLPPGAPSSYISAVMALSDPWFSDLGLQVKEVGTKSSK